MLVQELSEARRDGSFAAARPRRPVPLRQSLDLGLPPTIGVPALALRISAAVIGPRRYDIAQRGCINVTPRAAWTSRITNQRGARHLVIAPSSSKLAPSWPASL